MAVSKLNERLDKLRASWATEATQFFQRIAPLTDPHKANQYSMKLENSYRHGYLDAKDDAKNGV